MFVPVNNMLLQTVTLRSNIQTHKLQKRTYLLALVQDVSQNYYLQVLAHQNNCMFKTYNDSAYCVYKFTFLY